MAHETKAISSLPAEGIIDPHLAYEEVTGRILRPALRSGFHPLWLIGFALSGTLVAGGAVSVIWLLWRGVGVWGVNIPIGWGFAIINFVWWIGIGHAGTLISAILLLLRQTWRTSINRFAEAMTLFAVSCAGLFPLLHLGRLLRFYYLLPYPSTLGVWPQWRSPLVWDVFAVMTYFTVSFIFWYVGLLPDLASMRDRATRGWVRILSGVFALGWRGSARHWHRFQTAYLLLAGLATPLVVSVHSIVSLDFATATLPGWHSTVFPPYFVAGAVYAGFAMVILLAVPLRAAFGFHDLITNKHFDLMGKVMLTSGLVVAYGYLMETFTAWYSGDVYERFSVANRALGPYGPAYWLTLFCNVVVAQALWFRFVRQSPAALMAVSVAISIGMWFERFVIVVVSLHRDYMPSSWGMYWPTIWDITLFVGTLGLFFALLLLFVRWLPSISAFEVRELLHHVRHGAPQAAVPAEEADPLPEWIDQDGRALGADEPDAACYGTMGEFVESTELLRAAREARGAGYQRMDAYTPFPVEGLSEALGQRGTRLPAVALIGAALGGGGAYLFQWYTAVHHYPLDIGGRPLHSWPSFIPLTFELAVLGAALSMVGAMLLRNGFPQPYHPVFDAAGFVRASTDRFFLCVECRDPRYDGDAVAKLLEECGAVRVSDVPLRTLQKEANRDLAAATA
jgi:Ni/Fe-hydrogenase subunit HybB-like protein